MVSKDPQIFSSDLPEANFLQVKDPQKALQDLAKNVRDSLTGSQMIGITGSNGKTIVKEWLWTLISSQKNVYKNPKSYNSQIGLPLSLLMMQSEPEIAILEAGISQRGEMENLEDILHPEVGIFTNLGTAHQEGFDSPDQKLKEKLKLFKNSKLLIARGDQDYSAKIESAIGKERLKTWGPGEGFSYRVEQKLISQEKSEIKINGEAFEFHKTDAASLENICHCLVTALELGFSPDQLRGSLSEITGLEMRMDLKKGNNGSWIINDSYSLDANGLNLGLEFLLASKHTHKKSLILSDLPGEAKADDYKELAKTLSQLKLFRFVGIGKELLEHGSEFTAENLEFYSDIRDLLANWEPEGFVQETILISGSRKQRLEQLVPFLEERVHGTKIEIDLEAIRHNLKVYHDLSKEVKMMVMVKGSGYGAGMVELAKVLQENRVDYLGVAYIDEGVGLRKAGIDLPIMVLNPSIEGYELLFDHDLEPEVFDLRGLSEYNRIKKEKNKEPGLHINLDTGMHRLGFSESELDDLIKQLKEEPVKIKSVFSHLSSADESEAQDFTRAQIQLFESMSSRLKEVSNSEFFRHISNSAGIVSQPEAHYEMVRLGIGLYGVDPTEKIQNRLASTVKLMTEISQVKNLKKGDPVGYSRKGIMEKDGNIATLPIGYADGFLRSLGNGKSEVFIQGKPYPLIGNVCMDMIMVDLGKDEYAAGTPVEIFGTEISLQEFAMRQGSIAYEVLTQIGPRVKRIYISSH